MSLKAVALWEELGVEVLYLQALSIKRYFQG